MNHPRPLQPGQLTSSQCKAVNAAMIQICEAMNMEFAVLAMQGAGPLEIFRIESDPKWNTTTAAIAQRIKSYSDEYRSDAQN